MLFTGPAGSGTSMELDRLERAARANGHFVIRVKAINERYLGDQLAEAVRAQIDDFAKALPPNPKARTRRGLSRFMSWRRPSRPADDPRLEPLRQTVDAMGGLRQSTRRGNNFEVNVGGQLLGGIGVRTIDQSDQQSQLPRARPNQLADRLGEVAALCGKQAVFLIDDIHALDDKLGLAALNELARHVSSKRSNLNLAAGGRSEAYDELVSASSPNPAVDHDPSRLFDHRAIQPAAPAQMRDGLIRSMQAETARHEQLRQFRQQHHGRAEPPVTYGVTNEAADLLLKTAGSNVQMLEEYRLAAMSLGIRQQHLSGESLVIEPESAVAGIRHVHERRAGYYRGVWKKFGDPERELFRMVGRGRAAGLSRDDIDPAIIAPDRDPDATERLENLNRARERGLEAGWLTESKEGRIRFADAGIADWVCTEQLRTRAMTPQLADVAARRTALRGHDGQQPPAQVQQQPSRQPGTSPYPAMPGYQPTLGYPPMPTDPPMPSYPPMPAYPPMPTQLPSVQGDQAGRDAAATAAAGQQPPRGRHDTGEVRDPARYVGRHRREPGPAVPEVRNPSPGGGRHRKPDNGRGGTE
jgi:hypothetical protein